MSTSKEYRKPSRWDLGGAIFLNILYFAANKMWMAFFACLAAALVAVVIDPSGGEGAQGIYYLIVLVLAFLVWKEKIKIPA